MHNHLVGTLAKPNSVYSGKCNDRALDSIPQLVLSAAYIPSMTFEEFMLHCSIRHPALYRCLDLTHLTGKEFGELFAEMNSGPMHFEAEQAGGRGEVYREAQRLNPLLRARGVQSLFDLLKPDPQLLSADDIVLDVLGGNGTLARAMALLRSPERLPFIITSDVSASMVQDAVDQSLPAIRQPAQKLLFGTSTVDGVVMAYGTHHIPPTKRLQAFREAYRILKPGGRIVIQDFEEGGNTALWYSELLDQYTLTGHRFEHFTRGGLKDLAAAAGFMDLCVVDVYDPFVVAGDDAEDAERKLIEHVCLLFGLEKLLPRKRPQGMWKDAREKIRRYGTFTCATMPPQLGGLLEPTVTKADHGYIAEFPRVALVLVGTKR